MEFLTLYTAAYLVHNAVAIVGYARPSDTHTRHALFCLIEASLQPVDTALLSQV